MKILFIPHVPDRKIINRVYEFAKVTDSYFLSWSIDNSTFLDKIKSQLNSFFQKVEINDNVLTFPILLKPQLFATFINTKILNYAIKKFDIDVVVNANALLFDIKKIIVPVVYDLVDDHLEVNHSVGLNQERVLKIKRDIVNSCAVICVTEVLEKKVKLLNQNTITVENGLYIEKFKRAKSLKKDLGLENKKVFGYIGGVDKWTGIDRACESYMKIKSDSNAFIIVGDSKSRFFQDLKGIYKKDILFVGIISPLEVGNYFKTLDVGLIPFKLNDFTHNAYPIKALEYGLAGVGVISTPLKVLESKDLPFITFGTIDKFDKLMLDYRQKDFNFDFDSLSWEKQSQKLLNFIVKNVKS